MARPDRDSEVSQVRDWQVVGRGKRRGLCRCVVDGMIRRDIFSFAMGASSRVD